MQTLRQPLITDSKQPYLARIVLLGDFLPHSHDELEIVLLLSGSAVFTIDGVSYNLQAGDAALVAPNLIHTIRLPEGLNTVPGLLVECGYALFGDDYEQLRGKLFQNPVQHIFSPDTVPAKQLSRYIRGILRELSPICPLDDPVGKTFAVNSAPEAVRSSAIRSLLFSLFVWLVRDYPTEPVRNDGLTQAQKLRWSTVFDFIAAHYREPLRVEQAASLAGYSVYHFSRCFREYTGLPFHRYLNRYRVEKAVLLLSDRTLAMTQIAEQSGFESIKTFNRVFRQETGESPSSFREKHQGLSASSPKKTEKENPPCLT